MGYSRFAPEITRRGELSQIFFLSSCLHGHNPLYLLVFRTANQAKHRQGHPNLDTGKTRNVMRRARVRHPHTKKWMMGDVTKHVWRNCHDLRCAATDAYVLTNPYIHTCPRSCMHTWLAPKITGRGELLHDTSFPELTLVQTTGRVA